MNYIIGLIGPSGSGKTSIILGALKNLPGKIHILQSSTTRERRDELDNQFYNFISREQFQTKIDNGEMFNYEEYAGNLYGSELGHLQETLAKGHAILAIVESAIPKMKALYPIKLVRINPIGQKFERKGRADADKLRASKSTEFDLVIDNSFESGGLERAVSKLSEYISKL